jgi:hypothetical protein
MSGTTPRPAAGASAPKTGRPVAALLGLHSLVVVRYGGRGRCGADQYRGHRGRNRRPHCLAQLIAGGVRPGSGKL